MKLLFIEILESGNLHLGIKLREHLHCKRKCLIASFRVNSLLITGGGLGTVVVAKSCATNTAGLEVCNLENNALGIGENGILCTAHNTCQSNCALGIGNYKVVGGKSKLLVVKKLKLLAVVCTSNLNMVDNMCRIKNVGRLTGSKHYVVGNINECVDGT